MRLLFRRGQGDEAFVQKGQGDEAKELRRGRGIRQKSRERAGG